MAPRASGRTPRSCSHPKLRSRPKTAFLIEPQTGRGRYAPTNIILIRTHGRRGIGWITLAGGLAALCFYAAAICTVLLSRDGPGWLNLLVLLFIWDGFKMLRIDPVTLMLRRYIRTEPEPECELEPEPDAEAEAEPASGAEGDGDGYA